MGTETNSSKSGQSSASDKFGTGKIVIKFSGDFKMPYDEKIAEYLEKTDFKPWISLKKEYPGIEIRPVFTKTEQENLKTLVKRAEKLNPRYKDPDFFRYFVIDVPKDSEPPTILKLLKSWKELKHAYIEPVTVCANPLNNYGTNTSASSQNYLDAAPMGISSKTVWSPTTVSGSDGAGIKFIDLETGWNLNHADLVAHSISLVGTSTNLTPINIPHGTSVLGIVCASDDHNPCIGVAPNPASVKVISPTDTTLAGAIGTAAANLGYGDVLLIALNTKDNHTGTDLYVPVEVTPLVRTTILTATSAGVIVIEPGGDGNLSSSAIDFDTYQNAAFDMILNPTDPAYIDSGAIIVSASLSATSSLVPVTHEKAVWAPHGARVDCYAWGENITTINTDLAGADNTSVTSGFGFSSGAAAIIAGAVLSIQGIVKAKTHCRIGPAEMRSLLKNSAYGTNLVATGTSTPFGIFMPDISAINTSYIPSLNVFSVDMTESDPLPSGTATGSATATPHYGMAPYTYLWNDPLAQTGQTATALLLGTYTVTVTDKHGCVLTGTIAVGDISATVTKTDVTCNGASNGTITITVTSGGTSPFSYSIDGGLNWTTIPASTETFNLLGPNSYTVIVKDSTGLTKPLGIVTITEPAVLDATVTSLNSTTAGLNNGEIHITLPTGGSGSFEYALVGDRPWQSSADFYYLGPKTYNVQMRDAVNTGCVKVLNAACDITEPAPAFSVTATVTDVIKFGDHTGKIVLVVSGGTPPYTITCNSVAATNIITGLAAGTYLVTVNDNAVPQTVVNLSVKVKHIYAEIVRNVHHGILIRLLKFPIWNLTGYKTYKVMWKGYPFHPPFFHPHVEVFFNHVTAGPILSETVGGVTWNYRWLKVPNGYEGDVQIMPSGSERPIFIRSIIVPVKLFLIKQNRFPIFDRGLILIADFKMIINNDNVDYTL
jgi:hypothetical protein